MPTVFSLEKRMLKLGVKLNVKKISKGLQKRYFLTNFNFSFNFAPLPPLNFGPKFDFTPSPIMIEV